MSYLRLSEEEGIGGRSVTLRASPLRLDSGLLSCLFGGVISPRRSEHTLGGCGLRMGLRMGLRPAGGDSPTWPADRRAAAHRYHWDRTGRKDTRDTPGRRARSDTDRDHPRRRRGRHEGLRGGWRDAPRWPIAARRAAGGRVRRAAPRLRHAAARRRALDAEPRRQLADDALHRRHDGVPAGVVDGAAVHRRPRGGATGAPHVAGLRAAVHQPGRVPLHHLQARLLLQPEGVQPRTSKGRHSLRQQQTAALRRRPPTHVRRHHAVRAAPALLHHRVPEREGSERGRRPSPGGRLRASGERRS